MKFVKKRYFQNKKRIAELEAHPLVLDTRMDHDYGIVHNNIEYGEIETIWVFLNDGYMFDGDCSSRMCMSIADAFRELKEVTKEGE